MNKKNVLGKGLSALLHDAGDEGNVREVVQEPVRDEKLGTITSIELNDIEINPFQPRVDFDEEKLADLSASIQIHGVVQPITVRVLESGKYQLISGERRLRASKLAGLTEIPTYVRRDVNDQESLEIALIENIQREDLNAVEIAINYQRLMEECELTQEELSGRVGKKRSTVTNYLRLLKLPSEIQLYVKEGKLTMGHARALIGLEEYDDQIKIFRLILDKKLSVRQTEEAVKNFLKEDAPKEAKAKKPLSSTQQSFQNLLASRLTTKVQLKNKARDKGEIVISYHNEADLKRIMNLLND